MKKAISLIIFLFFITQNVYAGNIIKESDLEKIKSYDEVYLWMNCEVTEYDVKDFFEDKYFDIREVDFKKNWGFTFNDYSKYKEVISVSKWGISKGWELILYLGYNKEIVPLKTNIYKTGIASYSNWIDFAIIVKDKETWEIWIYKNKNELYSWFNRVDSIQIVNDKLIFSWEDKNWKNFINIDWEKQYTLNNYIVDSYKEINWDTYIAYKIKSEKQQDQKTSYDFYIYKNWNQIYDIKESIQIDYWVLMNNDFYVIYESYNIWFPDWYAIVINWETIKSEDYFCPSNLNYTKNGKYKIYKYYRVYLDDFCISVNWTHYSSNWNILSELSSIR